MSNILKNYFKILEVISSLNIVLNTENRAVSRFKMLDLDMVALSLTAEFMSIDSDSSFFNQLQNGQITNLIERSQYSPHLTNKFKVSKINKSLNGIIAF